MSHMITVTIDFSQIVLFLICIFYSMYRMFRMIVLGLLMMQEMINNEPLKHKSHDLPTPARSAPAN